MSAVSPPSRWDTLKQRLQRSALTAQAASCQDRQRQHEVFRQRALRLAAPVGQADFSRGTTRTLVFSLGEQHFGLPLSHVGQVYQSRPLTPVPRAPSWVLGIANFDARIRSVIDLARLLEISNDGSLGRNILLVRSVDGVVAAQVDGVEEVQNIDFDRLSAPDQQFDTAHTRIIRGVTPEHLVILSADALIAHTRSENQASSN